MVVNLKKIKFAQI